MALTVLVIIVIICSYTSYQSVKILSGGGGLLQITHIALLVTVLVSTASITVAEAEAYTVDPALIQTVQGYAAETHHGAAHVDRWNRVLDAFGVINHTSSMTVEQAQVMADKFNPNRWNPIVEALTALEQAQQQQPQQQDPQVVEEPIQYVVDSTLVATVQSYAAETQYGTEHVDRWKRVLDAFGVISHTSSMTAAEAQEMADNFSANRWNPIVEALTALEEAKKQDQQQSQQEQVNPNTCNWNDPNYVNPPSCFAFSTQTDQQRLNDWKNRIIPPSDLAHLKNADLSLYNRIVNLYTTINKNINTIQLNLNQPANVVIDWPTYEPTWTRYEGWTDELKRLANTPELCRPSNTECSFHPNGQVDTYTHTADRFWMYGRWIAPISIITFDDQGNMKSKTHKYGNTVESVTNYYTGTDLKRDYTRYYVDESNYDNNPNNDIAKGSVQTQTTWYDNPANTLKSHVDRATNYEMVYQITTRETIDQFGWPEDASKYPVTEIYYYPFELAKSTQVTISGISQPRDCLDYVNLQPTAVDCAPKHTIKEWIR